MGIVLIGPKFCEIIVNWSSFSQKMIILVTLPGVVSPPRTPKIEWGWFLWMPTFANTSALRHGEKICPVCEIQESNNQVLVKKWLFWCHYCGGFTPPPPLKLGGDGSCECQISPTSPLHNTGKKLTCLWSLWVKQSNFSQKIVILASLRHCVMASFWCHIGVGFIPPGPPRFNGDGSYGCQIFHTNPL